jgi:microcystin-dependent protein
MYSLYHDNRNKCSSLIPHFDECCNYYMDRGLHVEGKLSDEIGVLSPEIGDIKMSARQDNYEGWLVCDGRVVSRTTYSALYSVIGSRFGNGDGVNTFNIPDSRGRVPLGAQSSSGTSYYCVGNTGGEENHTLTIPEIPSHDHSSNASSTSLGLAQRTGFNTTVSTDTSAGELDLINAATLDIYNTGGDPSNSYETSPHNNMQPYIVFGNYFIYCGVKDSRKEGCNDSFPVQPCDD